MPPCSNWYILRNFIPGIFMNLFCQKIAELFQIKSLLLHVPASVLLLHVQSVRNLRLHAHSELPPFPFVQNEHLKHLMT